MPFPIETLLRVHDSPAPAQIVFGACGSMATAPIDCALSLSKTGLNVVPPFEDFQTPPLAAPMYTVSRPSSFTAAIAATRPLMAAEPMFRAPRPEIVSESNLASWAGTGPAKIIVTTNTIVTAAKQRIDLRISADSSAIESRVNFLSGGRSMEIRVVDSHFPAGGAFVSGLDTGIEKCASSSGMFCSIFSTENCAREALPFCACSTANG